MVEIHTGAKPGRPVVLVLSCAGLLLGTLGLAWWQVRDARALGPEQRIPDTPLFVRLPRDWRPLREDPRTFVLAGPQESWRGSAAFERRITFSYQQLPYFLPPEAVLRSFLRGSAAVTEPVPARIGAYDAIEFHVKQPLRLGTRLVEQHRIFRVASLPRGQVIAVEYQPLLQMQPSDIEVLDEVCSTVRLADAPPTPAAADVLARAGLTLPQADARQVTPPVLAEVPGALVLGSKDGVPAWTLGLYRTWLAEGRSGVDLLADFAASRWLISEQKDRVERTERADGVAVFALRHPRFGAADYAGDPYSAVWLVVQSPSEALLILVTTGPATADAAARDAGGIANEIKLAPLKLFAGLDEAAAAGRAYAQKLGQRGLAARWGRSPLQTTYSHETAQGVEEWKATRSAVRGDPGRGYTGHVQMGGRPREMQDWTIDGEGGKYLWRAEYYAGEMPIEISESRSAAGAAITRTITLGKRDHRQFSFRPGTAFVPPPAAEVLEGWVARGEPPAALIETSAVLASGVNSTLLLHLPPDGDLQRVLVLDDFWPLGAIVAYDDPRAEVAYQITPAGRLRRVEH